MSTARGAFQRQVRLSLNCRHAVGTIPIVQIYLCRAGRACPLCPDNSDVNLFSNGKSIIHLDAEISDSAFDFGVTKKELYGS